MLGKEIRAGLCVVGTLLMVFCSVVFFRFSQGRGVSSHSATIGSASDLTEGVEPSVASDAARRHPQVRFHPTIVKSSAWDGTDFSGPGQVRTASADSYLDDSYVNHSVPFPWDQSGMDQSGMDEREMPRPVPAEYTHEMVNPRRVPEFRPIPRP